MPVKNGNEQGKARRKILSDCLLIHPCAGQRQLGTIQFLITNKLHDLCFIPLFLSLSLGSKTRSVQTASLSLHHSSQLSAISRRTKCNCDEKTTVCVATAATGSAVPTPDALSSILSIQAH